MILATPKRILIYSPLFDPALNHGRMTTGKHHHNNGPPSYVYVATLYQLANADGYGAAMDNDIGGISISR